jgi:acyl carrier protein
MGRRINKKLCHSPLAALWLGARLDAGGLRSSPRFVVRRWPGPAFSMAPPPRISCFLDGFVLGHGKEMNTQDKTQKQVLRVLDEVLSLGGRAAAFTRETPLLGAIPELDSMAVVTLLTTLEEQLGITVDDDDIDGDTFANVGSLVDFVSAKLAG